jgi:hypothetical protein
MNIEVADTSVATMVAAAATRKMVGSRAEPDPVPLSNAEDIKTALLRVDMPLFRDLASGNKAEVVSGVRPVRVMRNAKSRGWAALSPASPVPDTSGLRPARTFPIVGRGTMLQ